MLAHCKLIEKEAIIANATEKVQVDKLDESGEKIEIEQPVSVTVRCMNFLLSHLTTTCVQNWSRMNIYLEILYAFGVYSPEQIMKSGPGFTSSYIDEESDSVKVALHYFFSNHMIEKIGDFMLEDKSPFLQKGEIRGTMGTNYTKPEMGQILSLFNFLITQVDFMEKYPLDAIAE